MDHSSALRSVGGGTSHVTWLSNGYLFDWADFSKLTPDTAVLVEPAPFPW